MEFNNTFLYQNEEGGNTVTTTSTSLPFKFVGETIRHHYYCMLVNSCMLFFLSAQHRCFRSSEFSNTLLCQNEGGRKHSHRNINIPVFHICSRNNKTSLLLYACKVINLINKGVISPYVQEQGEMLLKCNIRHLHYVTYYWS